MHRYKCTFIYHLPKNGCTFGFVTEASSSGFLFTAILVVGVASPLVLGPCFSPLLLVLAESADESTLVSPLCVEADVSSASLLLSCGHLSSIPTIFAGEAASEVSHGLSVDIFSSAEDRLLSVVDRLLSLLGENCPFDFVAGDFRLLALGPTFPVCFRAV